MKYRFLPFRYVWLTFRLEQFWFPAAFLALFALITWIIGDPEKSVNAARAFLGVVLPLMAGVLAAYAVLDDHALELQFSTPRPAWLTLLERLGLILAVIALCALVFQVIMAALGYPLSVMGSLAARQLAWLLPSLALLGLGSAVSFALAHTSGGALLVGLIWIFQVIARGWFVQDLRARYLFLFTGSLYPDHPSLLASQAAITLLALALLFVAWTLFGKQERYI